MNLCPPLPTLITTTLRKDAPSVLGGTLQGLDFPCPWNNCFVRVSFGFYFYVGPLPFLFQRGPLTFWASSIHWVCQMLPLQSLFGMCKAHTVSTKQHLRLCFIIPNNDLIFTWGDISFLFFHFCQNVSSLSLKSRAIQGCHSSVLNFGFIVSFTGTSVMYMYGISKVFFNFIHDFKFEKMKMFHIFTMTASWIILNLMI